jgi:FtsH-binding integral membrane protein
VIQDLRGGRPTPALVSNEVLHMADLNHNATGFAAVMSPAETAAIDAGLRSYMLRVYAFMGGGLVLGGIAAMGLRVVSITQDVMQASHVIRAGRVIPVPAGLAVQGRDVLLTEVGHAVLVSPMKWAIIFAPLVVVLGLSFGAARLRLATAQVLFWLYAILIGLSLASIFLFYGHMSIAPAFFVTAAAFGALSLWGYTTRRDLTALRSFAVMGLLGFVVASLVNLMVPGATPVQWTVAVAGVLIFAALTAWDTQRLKNEYLYGAMGGEGAERSAVLGALSLYLDVINLFTLLVLVQVLGQREE